MTEVRLVWLGRQDYANVWAAMKSRVEDLRRPLDEWWLLEHAQVYTLGQGSDPAHILAAEAIPVVRTDRGGQVTYHGPGQLVFYPLLDLRERQLNVKRLVCTLEQAVIEFMHGHGIVGDRRVGAPGVYVDGRKIAALGLRVRRGRAYHGLSLNVAMDLGPFRRINPCGYTGLEVTQLADLMANPPSVLAVGEAVAANFARYLGINLLPNQ